ncbi:hypothetical protein V6N11_012697 [Hibiscus sabdariffa]|uniref:Retrotransposon gag domain-containing protein n=1 Tax=Hibiscus sabdariffa TaxID=183260 RepID=A0ABR2QBW9_9ROSI
MFETRLGRDSESHRDEHKLECAIALLADEALSWWETTTLTAPAENVTWIFFVEEFKKKYIIDQYLADQYIKTEKEKCRKFTDGLNEELSPMFTALEIIDFQILVNRVVATEAKMKVVEKGHDGNKSSKKQKREDKPQWQSKKAKYHNESSMTYTQLRGAISYRAHLLGISQ